MKNLKKVLALGLALVMILGMFTIASAAETEKKIATEFTDWDKVAHKDAVALCVDLGIINGLPDGSFAPDQTIDRASWAKLVYFTATGDDNADAYLGANVGMKDIAGNWAESYINYLVANKYVSGDGLGNYMPTGTVTVSAGLKTMLTVLGYDADDRGYQNDAAWMGNIMTDAKRNGLMDDVDRSQTAAVNLTRENAAQIVYNALMANIVEPVNGRDNGDKYVSTYEKGATLGYDVFKIIPVTVTLKKVNDKGIGTFEGVSNNINGSALGDVKAPATLVGELVTVWVKATGVRFADKTAEMITTSAKLDKVVSTTAAKAASSAAKTFTGGVTLADIWTPNKDDYVADCPTKVENDTTVDAPEKISYYKNSEESTQTAVANAAKVAGNVVDVFTADGKVSMIKVTTYELAQVTADIETRTRDKELQVKIDGVFTGWVAADKVEGYQGLAKDDVVLVNMTEGTGIYTLEKADKVTGKVTLRSGLKLTVSGTQYGMSGITNNSDLDSLVTEDDDADNLKWDVKGNKDNEYDFYLDKNGTIAAYKQISGEVTKEVAYVLDAAWVGGNGSLTASKYAEAELLFADGTTEIVNVAKVDGDKVVAEVETGKESEQIAGGTVKETINGKFIDFAIDSKGNYEVEVKEGAVADLDASTDKTTEQKPAVFDGLTADAKTTFLVKKGDDYFTYTGYKNLPKMDPTAVVAVAKDGIATYVYLTTDKYEGEGSKGLIWIKDTKTDKDINNNLVYSVVNAEGAEEKIALAKGEGVSEITAKTFYIIDSIDDDGVATVIPATGDTIKSAAHDTEGKANTMTAQNTTMLLKDVADKLAYDSETVAVVIDLDTKGDYSSSGKLSLNNYKEDLSSYTYDVTAVVDGVNVDFVYVVRTEIDQTAD